MKQTRVAIYSRVSGSGQNPEMQIKELQAYCRSPGLEDCRRVRRQNLWGDRLTTPTQ